MVFTTDCYQSVVVLLWYYLSAILLWYLKATKCDNTWCCQRFTNKVLAPKPSVEFIFILKHKTFMIRLAVSSQACVIYVQVKYSLLSICSQAKLLHSCLQNWSKCETQCDCWPVSQWAHLTSLLSALYDSHCKISRRERSNCLVKVEE